MPLVLSCCKSDDCPPVTLIFCSRHEIEGSSAATNCTVHYQLYVREHTVGRGNRSAAVPSVVRLTQTHIAVAPEVVDAFQLKEAFTECVCLSGD